MAALKAILRPSSSSTSPPSSSLSSHAHSSTLHPQDRLTPHHDPPRSRTNSTSHSTLASSKKSFHLGLHAGAASNNLGLVKFALDNGQAIDSVVNGVLAIHAACCSNANVPVVLYLIERGADVNSRRCPRKLSGEKTAGAQTVGTTGSTPLHFAAANGCLAIVEILLRHGATVDLTDKYGSSPLSVAIARNHPEVAQLLQQHSAMQRGVLDLIPSSDSLDPFVSPRNSADMFRRSSTTGPPLRTRHQKESTTHSLPLPTIQPTHTRSASHRRVSLPSIIESPCSPIIPTAPRQSCDFGRAPLSSEPLSRTEGSVAGSSKPRTLSDPTQIIRRPSQDRGPLPQQRVCPNEPSKSLRQTAETNTLLAPSTRESTPSRRRKSVEVTTGFLSPQSAMTINRRRSLEQVLNKKRHSNAPRHALDTPAFSTRSSSATEIASFSIIETLTPQSNTDTNTPPCSHPTDSGNASLASSPLVLPSNASERRGSAASQSSTRPSLDLHLIAPLPLAPQENDHSETHLVPTKTITTEKGFRRHSLEAYPTHYGPNGMATPRLQSMGPALIATGNGPCSKSEQTTPKQSIASLVESDPASTTSSLSSRRSMGPHPSSRHGNFSGSATVSGRFSRMWSYANGRDSHKDGATAQWHAGELAEESREATLQELTHPESGRSRRSLMNRLSGIWSRR